MKDTLPGLSIMDEEVPKELVPLTAIRTETALSRFPVHRIAKKGSVRIDLKHQASALVWRVSYNSEYGQPGPLAYKLDSLVVNRRIEEKRGKENKDGKGVPKLIRLGTLSEIAEEVGAGAKNTGIVKQALLQNAFAAINAKIKYRTIDQGERTLEAAFTRYSLIFTGDALPTGGSADAVHLVLNDVYMEVLNSAIVRPLDYEYMKKLPPAAQRFYEIVSYQIYAALLHQNERAKLRYSEYCLLSTATRYLDFDHVKKQMHKIHATHISEGYLTRVTYEATVDEEGQPDWFMWYTPGPNASREYSEFTQAGRRNKAAKPLEGDGGAMYETLALAFGDSGEMKASPVKRVVSQTREVPPAPLLVSTPSPEDAARSNTLIARLLEAGLNQSTAKTLAEEKPDECQRQLDYLPYFPPFKTSKGAYLRRAIENGFAAPEGYQKVQTDVAERKRKQEETTSRNARKAAQEARRAAEGEKWAESMSLLQNNAPEAFSGFLSYVASQRQDEEAKHLKLPLPIRTRMLKIFDSPNKQLDRFAAWSALRETGELSPEFMTGPVNVPKEDQTEEPEDVDAVRAILGSRFGEDTLD